MSFVVPSVFAAEDQFRIGQLVSNSLDVTAPSIPTGLVATAVSTSQIDLSWTASTDDTAVTGYNIYRDASFLTTSVGTTYSDTGLSPATTYTYTVSAFDAASNESGQSAAASSTTFSLPPVEPPPVDTRDTSTTGGSSVFRLTHLNVSPGFENAVIQFGTNTYSRAIVYWGTTPDYELGSLASGLYQKDHSVLLTDLSPGRHYFFKIELTDGYGRKLFVNGQEFTTLSLPDTFAPANVSDFVATPSRTDITLTWKHPNVDSSVVRIVKSELFFPRDPFDGQVIYEGEAERFVDRAVVAGKTYYYTAFSLDAAGNYSSGAVTSAHLLLPGEEFAPGKLFGGILQLPQESIDPLLRNFVLGNVDFVQNNTKLPVVGNTVEIHGDRNLIISIDYEKMPEILKTIVVTLFDPDDKNKTFSFLLRVNADKTAYEAEIAAFERSGTYEFTLDILDHKHRGLVSIAGTLISRIPDVFVGTGGQFPGGIGTTEMLYSFVIALILFLLIILALYIKRKISSEQVARPAPLYKKF